MCDLKEPPIKFLKQMKSGSGPDFSLPGAVKGDNKKLSLLILPRTAHDYFGLGTHMLSLQRCIWVHFVNPCHCVSGITDL